MRSKKKKRRSRAESNRRGQVTLFIIIALAVILAVVLVVTIITNIKKIIPEETESLSSEARGVKEYIELCLKSKLEDGLRRIGENGGYLTTDQFRTSPVAYESQTIQIPPQKIPYWYHAEKCDKGLCLKTNQPPLCRQGGECVVEGSTGENSIEESLSTYIEDNAEKCLGEESTLNKKFVIRRAEGDVEANVMVAENSVNFNVEMPITAESRETEFRTEIQRFRGKSELDFADIYRLSSEVLKAELKNQYLERATMHLISAYSGLGRELPPVRDVTMLSSKEFWVRSEVESLLEEEILPYTSFIQVANAYEDFVPLVSNEEDPQLRAEEQGFYSYLTMKTSNNTYPSLGVDFLYPYSDIYLDINGDEVLKPNSLNTDNLFSKLLGAVMQDYQFHYDISYPVRVSVKDEDAFNGRGYELTFGLEANIVNNQPVEPGFKDRTVKMYDSAVDLNTPDQRVNNSITVKTFDRHTGEPVVNVSITYQCDKKYPTGEKTHLKRSKDGKEEAVWKGTLPYCRNGGVILLHHEDYQDTGIEYDNYEEGVEKVLEKKLWPIKKKDVVVMKRTYEDVQALESKTLTADLLDKHRSNLSKHDKAIINIKKKKKKPYEESIPMIGVLSYTKDNSSENITFQGKKLLEDLNDSGLSEEEIQEYNVSLSATNLTSYEKAEENYTLDLVPGTYKMDNILLYEKKLVIPKSEKEYCKVEIGECLEDEKVKLPRQELETWASGGAKHEFKINEPRVYDNSTLYIYVLEQKIPRKWDDMMDYKSLEEYQDGKKLMVAPSYEK